MAVCKNCGERVLLIDHGECVFVIELPSPGKISTNPSRRMYRYEVYCDCKRLFSDVETASLEGKTYFERKRKRTRY